MFLRNANKNGSTRGPGTRGSLATSSYAVSNPSQPVYEFFELEAAEVIDVILDSDHPEFYKWEDIGKVQIRMITSEYNKAEETLVWALPMEPNIRGYPLKHEIVVVGSYLDRWFYTQRINALSNVNHNDLPWISIDLNAYKKSSASRTNTIQNVQDGHTASSTNMKFELGNQFEASDEVKPLRHYEGDIIMEGRFGQSVRFTSNQEDEKKGFPIIKIRNGQFPEASRLDRLELIEEDINKDASSIYMTKDWEVPLEPATKGSEVHYHSVDSPPDKFDQAQIVTNADRQVHNARSLEYIVFSKKGIYMMTEGMATLDAVKDIRSKTFANHLEDADENIESKAGVDIKHDAAANIINTAGDCYKSTASNTKIMSSGTTHLQGSQNLLQGPTVIQGPLTVTGPVTIMGPCAAVQFVGPMPTPGPVAPTPPSPAPC